MLRTYLSNVRDWHGYIRFLGLPDRRDNPDILIDRLFVEPLVTRRHVSPDEDPSIWRSEAASIFDVLKIGKPVVLLGDPGTGKSTLLNYLVWLLARPTVDVWSKQMDGWLLPVPMLLRDLRLRGVRTFRGLLDAFLRHAMCEPLRENSYLKRMLKEGRALILLDGIDEIGDPTARRNLHKAVYDGFARYPRCRWLLSSRIVGYDEVPFDRDADLSGLQSTWRESRTESFEKALRSGEGKLLWQPDVLEPPETGRGFDHGFVITRYIAPFDDGRIEAFARNWYVQREAAATRAGEDALHLVRAVHADDAILRLARVPNLLTMMALIHRIEATLPHGRALLYERIAEAYLESIDRFRGFYSGAYNLPQKRRWLARVGYEMQRRRSTDQQPPNSGSNAELLAEAADVISWLDEEMQQGNISEQMSAEEFLDFVGRRSGLFLPRGDGRYAFVHLSFQEYFAAVALEREVTGLNWARGKLTPLGLDHNTLAEWAGQSAWRETFTFLFELLASREDWHAGLLDAVFGEHFDKLEKKASDAVLNLGQLLARLVVNPRSGLVPQREHGAIVAAVRAALRHHPNREYPRRPSSIFMSLFGDNSSWNAKVLTIVGEQLNELDILSLPLTQMPVVALEPLAGLTALESLDLSQAPIADLAPLAGLTALESLDVSRTSIADLGPLAGLTALESLDVSQTSILDLRPLAGLTALRMLDLGRTPVADLGPLAGLTALRLLFVGQTPVADIEALAGLTALRYLYLWQTSVADLKPLADVTSLISLDLDWTQVADFSPLAKLTALESLSVSGTQVADLSPMADLTSLKSLNVSGTQVADLSPLADLTALESLDLSGTQVANLSPVADLTALKSLDLSGTQVADLSPLADLTPLNSLLLKKTQVSKRMISGLRDALPACEIVS